jgi:hypothetical protein
METFDKNDWAHLHDVVVDCLDKSLSQPELEELFNNLPDSIKKDAIHWGLNDTVVRDNIWVHLNKLK